MNEKQLGIEFRKSTTDALLYFLEKIVENLEHNSDTCAVLLDHAKTFKSIPD